MKTILKYLWIFLCLLSLWYRPYSSSSLHEKEVGKVYLSIPNTSLFEEVVQGNDNTYYLSHDKEGQESKLGAIFLDYRTKVEDKVTIIYGHNSATYDIPFHLLEEYQEAYLQRHDTILLEEGNAVYTYKIFSVFVAYQDFFYMQIPKTEEEFLAYVNHLKEASWYSTLYLPKKEDSLLLLQTCSYHKKFKRYKEKYLILAAGLVKE